MTPEKRSALVKREVRGFALRPLYDWLTSRAPRWGEEMAEETYRRKVEELRGEHERLLARAQAIYRELHQLAAPRGDEPHYHGQGVYGDPFRGHAHPFTEEDHEHVPGSPEDAPWPDDHYA